MIVNKVGHSLLRQTFKGYQHVQNDVGADVMRFNYPYDYKKEICEIEIYKVDSIDANGYRLVPTPIATVELQEGGVDVDIQAITDLSKDAPFAYRYVRRDKETGEIIASGADSGVKINSGESGKNIRTRLYEQILSPEYTLVTRNGTTPKIQGAGYLGFPDSQRVGYFYRKFDDDNTGEIYLDKKVQKEMENTIRTFSNKFGGNLAGLEQNIDYLNELGVKVFFANPIAGADNKTSHHYWNKNNFQISDDVGNVENFKSFTRRLFQKGINYVYDGTFTSEGLEGIHFQYALRWANQSPQSFYWFKMSGLKDSNLGLGTIPRHKENLRHRIVNSPRIWDEKLGKAGLNPDYDPHKETYIQIYDASQVSEEQISKLDKPIENYEKIRSGNPLEINSHDDTLVNYICQVDPKEIIERFVAFEDFNKNNSNPVRLNTPEGTILFAQFSNFRFEKKTEGGFQAWDANTDMAKMNYDTSAYDEKLAKAIVDDREREYELMQMQKGAFEVKDMALQAGRYWTKLVKDNQTLYTAQVLKGAKTAEKLQELIDKGLLPKEAFLNQAAIDNIKNGYYKLDLKGVLDKDSVTLKALMDLPLDTLELADNTVGVLSTSFFSNRAIDEETLGLSRFELMRKDNPHLTEPYQDVYKRMNLVFIQEIKDFTDEIIKKVNETSNEKLLDENGDYTEYGEYVVELMAPSITKYALLKSLVGDKLKTKILPNGEITYDYQDIREKTSLQALGIEAVSPEDEANQLLRLFEKGVKKLSDTDVEYLVKSVSKNIEGTSLLSFNLAEAIVKSAGLGLSWRLDAAKDVMDQDAVRNREATFDETWQKAIDFWKMFVQTVKKENPNSYIVAEITDIQELMKASVGELFNAYDDMPDTDLKFKSVPDAMMKFFNETGITSEAAYSYFFTDLIYSFSAEFENGGVYPYDNISSIFIEKVKELIATRGVDFVRNLFTFVGNHDKPRILHGLALDMGLFLGKIGLYDDENNLNYKLNRRTRLESMLQLTNSDSVENLSLEARLNVDNLDYFRTVSTKAVAMSKLLRDSINESLKGVATKDEINFLKLALVDLTNGNFGVNRVNLQVNTINIKELSSLENALKYLLEKSGIKLTEKEFNEIIEIAKREELIEKYLVHGDFDLQGEDPIAAAANRELLENILKASDENAELGEINYSKYSLYTTNIAGILREAFVAVKGDDESVTKQFFDAEKEFVETYDKEEIEKNRTELPQYENSYRAMAKNGYAARDIETAVKMLIEQAENIAREQGQLADNEKFVNHTQILVNVFKEATEPAVQKATMMYSFLNAIMGISTIYGGDELGMSGWEEKAKNIYLQNRNALPWSELEEGPLKEYRQRIFDYMSGVVGIRSREGVDALNNGTPYMLESSNKNMPAYLMQDAYGNMTISVFDATEVNPSNKFDYFDYHHIDSSNSAEFFKKNQIESINPNNRFVPIQKEKELDYIALGEKISLPIGLQFVNSNSDDKTIYEVGRIAGVTGLVLFVKNGKILLNGKTAKNGTMILKHFIQKAKTIGFRGGQNFYNKQYNIVSNPYQRPNVEIKGEKLSTIK